MKAKVQEVKNWENQLNGAAAISPGGELISGKDPGAEFGKGIYDQFQLVVPATYAKVLNRNNKLGRTISRSGAWVHYLEGSRKDLKGIQYFWGSAANNLPGSFELFQDKSKKAELVLESVLADLAILNVPDTHLVISLSNHEPEKWGQLIKQNLEGEHLFEHLDPITRNLVQKAVTIEVVNVYPEGFGSIAYCLFGNESLKLDESERAISLDIGSSTLLITVFDGSAAVIERYRVDGGCGQLYQKIAEKLDLKTDFSSKLRLKDDKHKADVVRKGVENRSFEYGNFGCNFKNEYEIAFQEWWTPKFEEMLQFLSPHLDFTNYYVAWGGGVNLPLLTEQLQEFDFKIVQNPQYVNAMGLKLLSEVRVEK